MCFLSDYELRAALLMSYQMTRRNAAEVPSANQKQLLLSRYYSWNQPGEMSIHTLNNYNTWLYWCRAAMRAVRAPSDGGVGPVHIRSNFHLSGMAELPRHMTRRNSMAWVGSLPSTTAWTYWTHFCRRFSMAYGPRFRRRWYQWPDLRLTTATRV